MVVFGVGDEIIISGTGGIVVTVTRTVIEPQKESEALLAQAEGDEVGLEVLQVGMEEGEIRDSTVHHKDNESSRLHSDKKASPKLKMIQGRTSLEEIFDHSLPTPSRLL